MKISKHLMTIIVAGSTVAAVATSCEKEDLRPNDNEKENPNNGGNNDENDDTYCPACGMG